MCRLAAVFGALLSGQSVAAVLRGNRHVKLHSDGTVSMRMQMYRSDCSRVPGAGMDPQSIQPFSTVLKDGFYGVECVDDYMFMNGDKFGNNKFSYKLGELSNVSIVHYDMHISKEDREPITPQVCFAFCRTVPDMTFFGILNGNQCYCTPYYQSIEGDDSMCDVVCEGDSSQVCGSKTKSSIFGMHSCNDVETVLSETADKAGSVLAEVQELEVNMTSASADMQAAAHKFQDIFSAAGDPVAADLMQKGKEEAGVLEKLAGEAQALATKISADKTDAESMVGDFSAADMVGRAQDHIRSLEELKTKGAGLVDKMQKSLTDAKPTGVVNTSALYYPVMYFVDRDFVDSPSTCGGETNGKPLLADLDACATACNRAFQSCVGFSHFPDSGSGLCFLFSKLNSATYYTKCNTNPSIHFTNPMEVKCWAKLSKFQGTSLKPDGSGKCDQCLKEATHADRCFV